jgi:hypothetical protein
MLVTEWVWTGTPKSTYGNMDKNSDAKWVQNKSIYLKYIENVVQMLIYSIYSDHARAKDITKQMYIDASSTSAT